MLLMLKGYFQILGTIQGTRWINLSVENFEILAKLRAYYRSFLRSTGLVKEHKHAHMHINLEGNKINTVNALTAPDDDAEVQEVPDPLSVSFKRVKLNTNFDNPAEDPKFVTEKEVQEEFQKLEEEIRLSGGVSKWRGGSNDAFVDYDMGKLEHVGQGLAPLSLAEKLHAAP
jgi:hypothetical protein